MTRINVGVQPRELCDQHLIAEYRELPRLWNFKPKSDPPDHFTLGNGHVLWCAQWPGMLAERYMQIVREMQARGFKTNYPDPPAEAIIGAHPPQTEIVRAREIVRQHINERLTSMRNPPRWTPRQGMTQVQALLAVACLAAVESDELFEADTDDDLSEWLWAQSLRHDQRARLLGATLEDRSKVNEWFGGSEL